MATPKKDTGQIILNATETGAFFGVTRRQVTNWVNAGCPKIAYGKFNLKDVFEWWVENFGGAKDSETTEEIKRDHWRGKVALINLLVDEKKGELVHVSGLYKESATRIGVVVAGLQSFKNRLPPICAGKTEGEMIPLIADETWELCNAFAKEGFYFPYPDPTSCLPAIKEILENILKILKVEKYFKIVPKTEK